ncbi:MAG: hypothetical protein AUK28_05420 [Desulfobacterales bacterium CG2_30_60_27]|nr:MAG: hypothetical protein AUK28_05420 [Desulfobacterales bacterium CG2_30_60_27]
MPTDTLHRLVLCLFLAMVFGAAGGCAPVKEPANIPEPTKIPAPANIPEDVRIDIYRDIAALVAAHLRAGDQHVRQGEFYDAAASYKAAYAYDDRLEGLQAKIVALEDKVARESARLYERGRGYPATDKERALVAFNAAIRLNPAHAEACAAYEQLRADQAIREKLAALEDQLRQESVAYTSKPEELQAMIRKNETLLSYDFSNQTALRLAPWLDFAKEQQVATYLNESEKLLAAGKLARTKAILQKAQTMAPDNEQIKALQKKVQQRQDTGYLLKLARDQMRQHDPRQALIYAGRILGLEPKHHEAREILREVLQARLAQPPAAATPIFAQREFTSAMATIRQLCLAEKNDEGAEGLARLLEKGLQREIGLMMERGQELYARKAYIDAQGIFEYVEELDPGNELAHTFIKKIENRLDTIESLQ